MAKDDKETPAETPKKKSKKLMIIIIGVVVLLGGGGGAFFMLKGDSATAAAPVKGIVTPLTDALTINLTDGHYLKLNFALQETADAGTEAVDTSEAVDLAINLYTGKTVAELSTEKGRDALKAELLVAIQKAYAEDKKQMVMGIYYTAFVTQ